MIEPTTRPGHDAFDALCLELDEYESLPVVRHQPPEPQLREHPEEQLDKQILAALVTP